MIVFTADKDLTSAPRVGSVLGFHVAETTGVVATVELKNGGASGTVVITIKLPGVTGGNSVHFAANRPMLFPKGLYVDVTTAGAVQGSIQPG
jgi:hypothetical protein